MRHPSLRLHKPSGQAVVTLSGHDVYCGRWGTEAARAEYDRIVAVWLANGRHWTKPTENISVARLVIRYLDHAEEYYRDTDGSMTSEVASIKSSMKPLVDLFGKRNAKDLGPADLKVVRNRMIDQGRVRLQINRAIGRIVRMFRWGVESGLVPADVWQHLRAVSGLRVGRSAAVESEPVRPVSPADIDAVVAVAPSVIGVMIRVQQLSGCRPGEVVQMTTGDIDRRGKVWVYSPKRHKTRHHGKERSIYLGPQAQELLTPWLKADPDEPLFSPREAVRETRRRRAEKRTTPPAWGNRAGSNVVKRPKRNAGAAYTVASYGRAIAYACEKAFGLPSELKEPRGKAKVNETPDQRAQRRRELAQWRAANCWSANQLRHTAATRFRREHGLEAAQILLGHSQADITQLYAERDADKAIDVALRAG